MYERLEWETFNVPSFLFSLCCTVQEDDVTARGNGSCVWLDVKRHIDVRNIAASPVSIITLCDQCHFNGNLRVVMGQLEVLDQASLVSPYQASSHTPPAAASFMRGRARCRRYRRREEECWNRKITAHWLSGHENGCSDSHEPRCWILVWSLTALGQSYHLRNTGTIVIHFGSGFEPGIVHALRRQSMRLSFECSQRCISRHSPK